VTTDSIILDHECVECGKREKGHWMKNLAEDLRDHQICFNCHFWWEKVDYADKPWVARIDGTHYIIGREPASPDEFQGFGGAEFRIRFHDGREVTSHNLWCQGDIPPHFRNRLLDNAEFINERS
jgi:hypothetical protein